MDDPYYQQLLLHIVSFRHLRNVGGIRKGLLGADIYASGPSVRLYCLSIVGSNDTGEES